MEASAAATSAASNFLWSSEALTAGHPDKLCDRVVDAVLQACLATDPDTSASVQACTKTGMIALLGEIATKAVRVDLEEVVREAVKSAGYDSADKGLDWRTMNVILAVESEGVALSQVLAPLTASQDASTAEVGVYNGYASAETPELMPLSYQLAVKLAEKLDAVRESKALPWVWPSGRVVVSLEYKEAADRGMQPIRIQNVAMVVQHSPDVKREQMEKDLREHVFKEVIPQDMCDARTGFQVSSASSKMEALAGRSTDAGQSGRACDADTYGGWIAQAASQISGHDGSKLARCGVYAARWAARSLVESRLCKRCHVQLAYTPGSTPPILVSVNSFGSAGSRTDPQLAEIIAQSFDFKPQSLSVELGLKAASWQPLKFSSYGHFGRADVPWERSKELR